MNDNFIPYPPGPHVPYTCVINNNNEIYADIQNFSVAEVREYDAMVTK